MSAATDSTMPRTGARPRPTPAGVVQGRTVVKWITTTDHKVIGNLYLITSFIWFLLGGLMALVIRAELVSPGLQVVDTPEQYNQMFTMHGTIMLLLFATPLFAGFANAMHAAADRRPRRRLPAPEHVRLLALPLRWPDRRRGLPHPRGAAAFGWFAYAPLSDVDLQPRPGR